MLNPGTYSRNIDLVLLLIRVSVGILMLTHGIGKFQMLFGSEPIQFQDPLGVGATTSLILAVFAEVLCSILIIIGLGTKFAAIPLLITMFTAAFIVHADDPFVRQELPLLYSIIFITILTFGAGKYSIDNLYWSKKIN